MRALALLLVLLLAPGARAADELPPALPLRSAVLVTADGVRLVVVGGYWVREDAAWARARQAEDLAAREKVLSAAPPPPPWLVVGLAVVGGVAVGYAAARLVQ